MGNFLFYCYLTFVVRYYKLSLNPLMAIAFCTHSVLPDATVNSDGDLLSNDFEA